MKQLGNLLEKLESKLIEARESDPCSRKCSGRFTFGNCIVTFYATSQDKGIEIWNSNKDTYLDNIARWLEKNSLDFDDIEVEDEDMWDSHGFRDESDYLNYKYG